jgi:hypothetical protein
MNTVVDLVRLRRIDLPSQEEINFPCFHAFSKKFFGARPPNLVARREGRLFI